MGTLRLIIPRPSYNKIMGYAAICDQEISGFADIEYNQEFSAFVVGEVYLLSQEVGPTETNMTEESVSELMLNFIKEGRPHMPRLWWHSHVNMGTFFSGTDEATMTSLNNQTYMVGLVVNKAKDMLAQVRMYCAGVTVENLPIQISESVDVEISEEMREEVKAKVKTREYNLPLHKETKSFKNRHILPRDKTAAKEKTLGCKRVLWDEGLKSFVYVVGKEVWIDRWGILDDEPLPAGTFTITGGDRDEY